MPAGLVSWWRAENDATDFIGGNNGVAHGGTVYGPGEVGQAFSFDGSSGYVEVPSNPNLKFTNAFTAEAWVNINTTSGTKTIVTKGLDAESPMDWLLTVNGGRLNADIYASGGWQGGDFATTLAVGVWNHVAMVYDGTSLRGYVNGVLDGVMNISGPVRATDYALRIGAYAPVSGTADKNFFSGSIDEVAVYSRALTQAEIQAIYTAGHSGKCFAPTPPVITAQPTNQTVVAGSTPTFTVVAAGTPPINFQWSFNGTNIVGATNNVLTLASVQSAQAGSYAVLVTNPYGSTNSSAAVLTVNPGPSCDPMPPGLVSWWQAENNATDFIGGNNGIAHGSTVYGPGEVGLAFSFDGSSGYVEVPSNPNLKFTNAFTAEAWVNINTTSGTKTIVTKGLDAESPMDWLLTVNGGRLNADIYASGGWQGGDFATTLAVGVWNHVAMVYDGTSLRGYVNGVLDGVMNISGPVRATDYALRIGAYAPVSGTADKNFFSGSIDEVAVYSRALTQAEIQAIYTAGHSGKCFAPTPPVITAQPTNQTVVAGNNVTMTVVASGTPPLSYQWVCNGTNIYNATNATLLLTNVQLTQAGSYVAQVSNIVGSTNSVTAVLTVNPPPEPPIGLVSWWRAENDATDFIGGNNGVVHGGTVYGPGEVGQAFSFDGSSGYVEVPSNPNLKFTNAFTAEAWVNINTTSGTKTIVTKGLDAESPMDWLLTVNGGRLNADIYASGGWQGGDFATTLAVGVWNHVAMVYDGTSLRGYVNGVLDGVMNISGPVRATDYALRIGAYAPVNGTASKNFFPGQIDELSVYNRALSSNEIATIYNAGVAGKNAQPIAPAFASQPTDQTVLTGGTATFSVIMSGTSPMIYQWSFNGTNVLGATNATLILVNVQLADSGNYAVLVTNRAGSTNSANATLTVVLPPVITSQPTNLTVLSHNSASFSVAASGTAPLSYRWRKNGVNLVDADNISGSATTNLNLSNVSLSDAGNYDVLVSNPYLTTQSAVAVLTVPQTIVMLGSTNVMSGNTIIVPVLMNALGLENTFLASVEYDPARLVLQRVQKGPVVADAYLQEVDSQTNNGHVGFAILLNQDVTVPAGIQEVADLVFLTLPITNNATVNLTFSDTPTIRLMLDNDFGMLPAVYEGGSVTMTPTEYAADVFPRTNGDSQVTVLDWLEAGRMIASLDTPTNSDERLRADCAPRNAPDGILTVADWVQAGRYALGLDPLTFVALPATTNLAFQAKPLDSLGPLRILQIGNVSAQRGQTVSVPVQLVCVTNENAVGMTVGYNPSQLTLVRVALGSAMTGGRLIVNSSQVTGEVGVALALSPGTALVAGTNQVAMLQFAASTGASGSAALTLDDNVVKLQVADKTANALAANYVNGAVTLPPQPTLLATKVGENLQLTWPVASGSFQVQSANSVYGPWSIADLTIITNGVDVTVTVTATNQQQYYRLLGQ